MVVEAKRFSLARPGVNVFELATRARLSIPEARRVRRVISGLGGGIEIRNTPLGEIIGKLQRWEDYGRLQRLLDSLPDETVLNQMHEAKLGRQPVVSTSLLNVVRSEGFHIHSSQLANFADVLGREKPHIPIKRIEKKKKSKGKIPQVYWIILDKHKERAGKILREDPSLQKFMHNPVTVVWGKWEEESGPLPSSSRLWTGDGFERLGSLLLKDFCLRPYGSRSRRTYSKILGDGYPDECPVPILKLHGGYFYPVEQRDALTAFVKGRLEKLRQLSHIDKAEN